MSKVIHVIYDIVLENIVKIIGIIMVFLILLQIFGRMFMSHPFSWTEELSRFTFIWFCFLGSVLTLTRKLHLGIDYFYLKLSPRLRKGLDFFIQSLIILFGVILTKYGLVMVGITSIQKSPVLRIPMSYMYIVLPITGILFIIYSFSQMALLIKQDLNREIKT